MVEQRHFDQHLDYSFKSCPFDDSGTIAILEASNHSRRMKPEKGTHREKPVQTDKALQETISDVTQDDADSDCVFDRSTILVRARQHHIVSFTRSYQHLFDQLMPGSIVALHGRHPIVVNDALAQIFEGCCKGASWPHVSLVLQHEYVERTRGFPSFLGGSVGATVIYQQEHHSILRAELRYQVSERTEEPVEIGRLVEYRHNYKK